MKKITKLVALAMAAVMVLSAVPAMAASDDPITDLYMYQTTANEMETQNILWSQYNKELQVLTNCIDGLVTVDNYGKLEPSLAESWETPDNGKTWIFHIRDGVKWVDVNFNEKADLTANDFVTGLEWILNFWKNASNNTSMPIELIEGASEYYEYTKALDEAEALALAPDNEKFAELVGCKAEDDNTLVYTCLGEAPFFPTVATYNCLYPASAALIEELGPEGFRACNNENMWYCGAYVLSEYIQGNEKVLTKNPTWWDTESSRFETVTVKMIESLDMAYQLYETGEVDYVQLTESNLSTINNDEGHQFHDYLVEARPTKYSYQIQFNYGKLNEDGTRDDNWDDAVANEAFRLSIYYGLEFGDYYKRTNAINPYKCYNNAFTMRGLVYYSDGTEYTERVLEKLGLGSYDNETMLRYDKEKAEAYKAQAIEELTAAGVTFPVHATYYYQASNMTGQQTAEVLKQCFSASLGDDYIVLDLGQYITSFPQEVRNAKLHSFDIRGWGADYGDPQNFLGQETIHNDNAFYATAYCNVADLQNEDTIKTFEEFTDMVNAANTITGDMDARYDAYADAEAFLIEHALVIPVYFNISWQLTKINDYSKKNAAYGIQNEKYVNWETSASGYTGADYEAFAAAYEAGE